MKTVKIALFFVFVLAGLLRPDSCITISNPDVAEQCSPNILRENCEAHPGFAIVTWQIPQDTLPGYQCTENVFSANNCPATSIPPPCNGNTVYYGEWYSALISEYGAYVYGLIAVHPLTISVPEIVIKLVQHSPKYVFGRGGDFKLEAHQGRKDVSDTLGTTVYQKINDVDTALCSGGGPTPQLFCAVRPGFVTFRCTAFGCNCVTATQDFYFIVDKDLNMEPVDKDPENCGR